MGNANLSEIKSNNKRTNSRADPVYILSMVVTPFQAYVYGKVVRSGTTGACPNRIAVEFITRGPRLDVDHGKHFNFS